MKAETCVLWHKEYA